MAPERRFSGLVTYLGRPWVVGLLVVAVVAVLIRLSPEPAREPPLQLVALGPDGAFRDTLTVPGAWRDTAEPSSGTRVPLVLGIRNTGDLPGRPARLTLSLPARYRLTTGASTAMEAELVVGSPLVTYTLPTGLDQPIEPGRLPTLLPSVDTVWLEVTIPAYHCVSLADSVPELIPAPPPLSTLGDVRIFYSFVGGDLERRRTGTLNVRLDSALLDVRMPDPPPSFPAVRDTSRATPAVGPLRYAGSRQTRCGEPQSPMEVRSTLWLTESGGRVLVLHYGGAPRKRLYDLNADGVVERESWDADGDGVFETTREARLPIPEFLLPLPGDPDPGDAREVHGPPSGT